MADTNRVWLSGVAASKPVHTRLPGKGLPICWFDLLVREDFQSKGVPFSQHTVVRVEALGQQAGKVFLKVLEGQRYRVDGYLKLEEGALALKVRAFAVTADESDEALAYSEGLRSALEIVSKSVDVKSAVEALRILLKINKRG